MIWVRGLCVETPTPSRLIDRGYGAFSNIALGNTGVQIASRLFLSPTTVQSHVVNALLKLNAKKRAHGIALALEGNELDL